MNRMCHFIWWLGKTTRTHSCHSKNGIHSGGRFCTFSPLTKRCSEKCLKVVEQTQAFNATKRLHRYQDVSYYTRMGKYSDICACKSNYYYNWRCLKYRAWYRVIVTTLYPIRWIKHDKWHLGRQRGSWGLNVMGFHFDPMPLGSRGSNIDTKQKGLFRSS